MSSDRPKALPTSLDLLVVVAAQLGIAAMIKSTGFVAMSDDDYSRVVIAQQFAQAPSWDPSGTSWLPFPFIHQGIGMKLFAPTLGFSRLWALFTSSLAAALLYGAARLWGLSSRTAILAAVVSAALPYSAYLAVATVPEYLSAALIVAGATAASMTSRSGRRYIAGGACFFLACASRYEAWPAAAGYMAVVLWGARRDHRLTRTVGASMAALFPLIWLLHGVVNHDHALFFVKRVVNYKEALGSAGPSGWELALSYPQALLLAEPELMFALVGMVGLALLGVIRIPKPAVWLRPWFVLLPVLATLIIGALRSGAPTHHAERALLAFWLLGALTLTRLLAKNRAAWKVALSATAVYAALGTIARIGGAFERAPFVDRSAEEQFGATITATLDEDSARSKTEPIALALDDYGYFALMAAAGRPKRFEVLETHDPREAKKRGDALQSYKSRGGCLYVVPTRIPLGQDQVQAEEPGKWQLRRAAACD